MAIKVGDEVIANWAFGGLIPGKRYKVTGRSYDKRNELLIKVEGSTLDYHHSHFYATSSDKPSPIRTRREIVPGVYGVVRIDKGANGFVFDLWKANANADELREAAHILNQIAEVLEENGNA